MKHSITCTEFRAVRKNTLRGFAVIRIDVLRLTIRDVALYEKGSSRWAALPAKPQIRDDVVVRDDAGKAHYVPLMEFASREIRDAFSRAVVAAVLVRAPDAFAVVEAVS